MASMETTDSLDTDDGPMRWTQIARVSVAYLRQPHHQNNMLATMDAASLLIEIAKRLDVIESVPNSTNTRS